MVSFTLPLPPLLKEWNTKEWNIGMFETPEIGWTSSESKQDEAKLDISNTQCR